MNKRKRDRGTQMTKTYEEKATQVGHKSPVRSYHRKQEHTSEQYTTYRYLLKEIINSKETAFQWCIDNKIICNQRLCNKCGCEMKLNKTNSSSDGLRWRCQKNGHDVQVSIRKGSWLEQSNLTLEEIIELTYWWSTGIEQNEICKQMGISSNTVVDWDMFCREACEVIMVDKSEPIGGEGVRVQIDESKFGKRKYHRGHKVEGQWVFGGIEQESRKNFMVAVDKRDRDTLLPIILAYIKPGSIIISDYWKPYDILGSLDFQHLKVNHSIEFVNENGDHTNKIEGHWRQAKKHLPSFGVRKKLFSSHLAEFMWRYYNKDRDFFKCIIKDIAKVYTAHAEL